MKVRILPSSLGTEHLQHAISFVINDCVAIDAGCLGFCGTPREQSIITHVALTHSHADHVCSLPVFAMNVCDAAGSGVVVYAPEPVLSSLRRDVFNGRVWPDFTTLKVGVHPLLTLEPLEPRQAVDFGGLMLSAIPVNHTVPTVAYVVDDGTSAVLFAVDTGWTEEVWDVARRHPRLKAAFVDSAFPDRLSELAARSGHLTPSILAEQLAEMPQRVQCAAVHIKAAFHDEVVEELRQVAIPNLHVGRIGHEYNF